ncbi:MAG: hypothetical protein ACOYNN_16610 [Terrimicrobiaceae bacterium]
MNIVLTSVGNFQDYIIQNIEQHIRLENLSIYVLTNRHFFEKLDSFGSKITRIAIEDLEDEYKYNTNSALDTTFRNGFWMLTSARFFYIYSFMKQYNISNVLHFENDVLAYYNTSVLKDICEPTKLYIPFDTFKRNIASIVYIPNHSIFKTILDKYDFKRNDMENFSEIEKTTNLIEHFPIFITNNDTAEHSFVTKNYEKFNMIFDAAAIGQYLGGVDPRNSPGDTTGFINETCIIKYNKYEFIWIINTNGIKQPYLVIDGKHIPIYNLHIHSKNLQKFM